MVSLTHLGLKPHWEGRVGGSKESPDTHFPTKLPEVGQPLWGFFEAPLFFPKLSGFPKKLALGCCFTSSSPAQRNSLSLSDFHTFWSLSCTLTKTDINYQVLSLVFAIKAVLLCILRAA